MSEGEAGAEDFEGEEGVWEEEGEGGEEDGGGEEAGVSEEEAVASEGGGEVWLQYTTSVITVFKRTNFIPHTGRGF